jgi:hypothetical protein
VHGIHEDAAGLVDRMRSGAGELHGDLAAIRQELLTARPEMDTQVEEEPEDEPEPEPAYEPLPERESPLEPESLLEPEPLPEPESPLEPEPEPEAAGDSLDEAEAPAPETPRARGARKPVPPTAEGARLVALNMALNGTPREEVGRYLADNFELDDRDAVLDDVYSRVGGRA